MIILIFPVHSAYGNAITPSRKLPPTPTRLSVKSGGGILQYEVWGYQKNGKTILTRYNLAYINPAIFAGDNGRVLGYDNAHGYHHRHYMGRVEPFEFEFYVSVLNKLQEEWQGNSGTGTRGRTLKYTFPQWILGGARSEHAYMGYGSVL